MADPFAKIFGGTSTQSDPSGGASAPSVPQKSSNDPFGSIFTAPASDPTSTVAAPKFETLTQDQFQKRQSASSFPEAPPKPTEGDKSKVGDLAMQFAPGTMQAIADLQVDPLSIHTSPQKFVSDVAGSISEPIKNEADNIRSLFEGAMAGDQNKILVSGLKGVAGSAQVAFSPISAFFSAINDIPILGTASKLAFNVPFAALGDAGRDVGQGIVDKIPLPDSIKPDVRKSVGDIFALAAQIHAGGKMIEDAQGAVSWLVDKGYTPEEAAPMAAKAQEMAKEKIPEPVSKKDTSVKLTSGLDPGIDKFISEDVKPALTYARTAMEKVKDGFIGVTKVLTGWFESAKPVQLKLGDKAYSDVIRAIHTPEAEMVKFDNQNSKTFDKNFNELEQLFNKFTPEQLREFNVSRGTAQTPEGIALQKSVKPSGISSPGVLRSIKEASDYVYNYARSNGIDIQYFEDYFYGSYKDAGKVRSFMEYWKSTEKYTQEKTIPTIADATAYGLELKDPNPIKNIRTEIQTIAYRVALEQLKTKTNGASFSASYENANKAQLQTWKPINDPVFAGKIYDPVYADFVNSVISTNRVTSNALLGALRQTTMAFQQIKFFGSLFHMTNMLKSSISDETAGVFNPKAKGLIEFGRAFSPIDRTDPEYIDYVNLGGGHKYSLESQSETQLTKGLEAIGRGNLLGGTIRTVIGATLENKWIPASPGFIHWMFDEYIPSLKFNKYSEDVAGQSKSLGRELADGEKIRIIKDVQNIYGEMNERLFGRSGTVTSALRLVFMAPGYGEGNFRNLARAAYNKGPAQFVMNSFITTLVAASIGTRVMTGQWPTMPTNTNEIRDMFKIKTNQKDGNGDQVMFDLMTYDKDFYSIYGNLATGKPGKMPSELGTRISGMTSAPFRTMNDMTTIFNGGIVVDWKGDPIYYQTDSVEEKANKFLSYEVGQASPISLSTYTMSKTKGVNVAASIASGAVGIRPTTSESVKDRKSVQGDLFSMEKERQSEFSTIKKLAKENPQEAHQQAVDYNNRVRQKLESMKNLIGADELNKLLKQYSITPMRVELKVK